MIDTTTIFDESETPALLGQLSIIGLAIRRDRCFDPWCPLPALGQLC